MIRDDSMVVVESSEGATLTIEAGVQVRAGSDALLLVTRGSHLVAEGTEEEPIVFTSAAEEREPGDWRGIVLAGQAPSHSTTEEVSIVDGDHPSRYGGNDPDWDCGRLRYVRVEFAGANLTGGTYDEPSAALNLAGCGLGTVVDHVQVHAGEDGIGIFGGNAPLTHVLVSSTVEGDSIEWRAGYRGRMQFIIAQNVLGSSGIKGNNDDPNVEQEPISYPLIFNATIVGRPDNADPLFHRGLVLQYGSSAQVRNSIIANFRSYGIDIESPESAALTSAEEQRLVVSHTILYNNQRGLPSGGVEDDGNIDDDGGFDEEAHFTQTSLSNRPLTQTPFNGDPTSITEPDFTTTQAAETVPYGGDFPDDMVETLYRGAIDPAGNDWTEGWTAFPSN